MMFDWKAIFVFLLYCFLAVDSYATEPQVHTANGPVKGSHMKTRLGKTIHAFRAVRYAKPPVGDLRFKNPEPVEKWTDVFDATQEGPACSTVDFPNQSEDCLRLNVYTTKLPNKNDKVKRPVIVFFHPGAFVWFTAQSKMFGPEYYLDKDIVLVTVNYRLGTLGFINTGDARAPGNLGLKDQVVALRWIQNNIEAFGGDPDSVTITGCSAGSWSVILHMMSPMSKGLFHRIIAMSGAPTVPDLLATNQTDLVIKQASFVGCPTNSVDAAFECLKTVPFEKFGETLGQFHYWYFDPMLVWSPVVEPDLPGIERFITAQPVDLIRTKKFQHVPVVVGLTRDEFNAAPLYFYEQAEKGDESYYKNMTGNWEYAAPITFQYQRDTERSKYISKELYKFYFNDKPITKENGQTIGVIYSDSQITFPHHRFTQLISKYSDAPVYQYRFTYQGKYCWNKWSNGTNFGVVHQDDLQYLFYASYIFPYRNATDPDGKMIDKLTTLWSNFALTGEPIPKNDKNFEGVTWATLKPEQDNYLEIDEQLTMKSKITPERFALWERLFPLGPIPSVRH